MKLFTGDLLTFTLPIRMAPATTERRYTGIGTSDGIAIGRAYVFSAPEEEQGLHVPVRPIEASEVDSECQRLLRAIEQTQAQIRTAQHELGKSVGQAHARIFDAHLLLLQDPVLREQAEARIRERLINAEAAFFDVISPYVKALAESENGYFKERRADIHDVLQRVLQNLTGTPRASLADLTEDVIVVAHDLSPSDTALMHRERVIALVTEVGGPTSHTSIMARALEIPAVAGVEDITKLVTDGCELIVDGTAGEVIVAPEPATLERYRARMEAARAAKARLLQLREMPAITTDGERVTLLANIEIPEEAVGAMQKGAEGIGLYRTEFFFMNRQDLPTEEEQYEAYAAVARACAGKPVVIRTLDLGGDKFVSSLKLPREMNPFMGWRAIRMCLERTDMFKTQLRAILRASAVGDVHVMFPMIASVHEVRAAKRLIEECKQELRAAGKDFNPDMPIGAMIEIPSAVMTADLLAQEVSFFSIGTNDLIQYTLAIDRVNEKTAVMYDPLNLAVLRLIKTVVDVAHGVKCGRTGAHNPACVLAQAQPRRTLRVSVCGEMAAEPLTAFLLVGLGVDELSTAASAIPENKQLIRAMAIKTAREVAAQALRMDNSDDVRELIMRHLPPLAV